MTVLRRLALATLFAAALVVPPVAAAKDLNVSVCGADGCTAARNLHDDGFALMPPGVGMPELSPWYRIRLAMGAGGDAVERSTVLWAPRIHMIAVDERHPRWLRARSAFERTARRITRGVEPFPAGLMPLDLPDPVVSEVIGPVATPQHDGGGGGLPRWVVIPVAGALAAVAALAYRSRRANARTASAPTTST